MYEGVNPAVFDDSNVCNVCFCVKVPVVGKAALAWKNDVSSY